MAGCVWGMWVAMGSNWKLITKFGCFYHFALQRSARECTKFLNACAVLLFCQLHLLFCHILVAIDVFGLHKLPNTNYFFKFVYVHNALYKHYPYWKQKTSFNTPTDLKFNSWGTKQANTYNTTCQQKLTNKRNRDSKISLSSVSKSPCKVVLKIIFKSIYFLSFLSHTSFSKSRFNILSASSIIYK